MENQTLVTPLKQPIVFELEGFSVPPGYGPVLFFLALFAYMVVLSGNGLVLCVIVMDKNLHRHMFVLVCHLMVCDLLGATVVLPRLMMHFLLGQKDISYSPAIAQAFCVHTYGVAVQTILGAMAYDRTVLLWMENQTLVTPLKQPIVFELEGFSVPPGYGPFLFFLAFFAFMVVLLGNGGVVCVIVMNKNLHRPMFLMICHLMACDLLGPTAVLSSLMMQFLMEKKISYGPAITQGFCVHTYGAAVQTVLSAMAYDRFVAVCEPLRYHSIMTSARLHSCCALAWIVALVLIAVLFSFHINVPLCGQTIQHVYCSNRAILDLACIPTPISNIYGLVMTWSVSSGTFVIIAFSYIRILRASLKQGRADSSVRSKAFQTCAPHIVVYVLYEVAMLIVVVSYRFPSLSQNIKKFFSILFIIIPPAINPIIYGLVSKDLRSSIIKHFSVRVGLKH